MDLFAWKKWTLVFSVNHPVNYNNNNISLHRFNRLNFTLQWCE